MKKKLSFPTAYSVLYIVLFMAALLTYFIPAGAYSKLKYEANQGIFVRVDPDGGEIVLPGTQETLDELGISNELEKFEDGSINKPVAIPGTYTQVESNPQGIKSILISPVLGVYDSIGIILFVLILGGVIGVLNHSGAIDTGIEALSKVTKGHEFLLIIFITSLIALGGTTFGLEEETIAFYPILIPVFLAAGYDVLVCIAAIYLGSSIGKMFSTTNPFSVVIGSNAAGINFTQGIVVRIIGLVLGIVITLIYIMYYAKKVQKNPEKSLCYDMKEQIQKRYSRGVKKVEFTIHRKLTLIVFGLTFVLMIYGVSQLGWWFEEMTALFLVSGVLIGILSRISEKVFVGAFIAGAADLVGVGLIIGIARSINIILEQGYVSDTILYRLSNVVSGMSPSVFSILLLFVFLILGFFIASSSGLATLAIPIMAPLADSVGVPKEVIITAYLFGQGLISFITPTGLILASLEMGNLSYNKWLRFVLPLFCMIGLVAIAMLLVQVYI